MFIYCLYTYGMFCFLFYYVIFLFTLQIKSNFDYQFKELSLSKKIMQFSCMEVEMLKNWMPISLSYIEVKKTSEFWIFIGVDFIF